tara:strand:- start:599 stop:1948 length:1350 start_codon:yes stop_codon:yes gene_type:complete
MRTILLISGLILSTLITSIKSEEITTKNLLDTNFDNGSWSGTADGRHGSTVIAAEHDTYIQSNDVSVKNDANLTEVQLQNGFTTNHQFEYWHWNTYESNVKSTVTITGADGETTTQIRNYNSDSCGSFNCGNFSSGSDTYTVLSNLQTDYDLSVRYDFTDSSNATNNHYGVDLKQPSLTLTYESDPIVIEDIVEQELIDLFEDFNPEDNFVIEETFEVVEFKEDPIYMNEPVMEEIIEFFDEPVMEEVVQEEKFDEPMILEEPTMVEEETKEEEPMIMDMIEMASEEENEETPMEVVMEIVEEEKEEEPKEIQEEKTNESETVENDSGPEQIKEKEIKKKETKVVSLDDVLEKIDEKVKDIGKNLQLKNLVKIKVMTSDNRLEEYNIPFYDNRIIYDNQINIADNRVIYQVDLAEYKQNDPIIQRRIKLNTILQERQDLINQLQVLKNG